MVTAMLEVGDVRKGQRASIPGRLWKTRTPEGSTGTWKETPTGTTPAILGMSGLMWG
jgi:hypothetical protein